MASKVLSASSADPDNRRGKRMAIDLKTKSDIQFTRDVLESLGEWKRAARMARAMIERYSARPDGQEAVNAYRGILISAMTEGGLPLEERVAECDKLFTG